MTETLWAAAAVVVLAALGLVLLVLIGLAFLPWPAVGLVAVAGSILGLSWHRRKGLNP